MKYKWIVKKHEKITKEFLDVAFGSEIIATLLLNRGIDTIDKAKSYLNPDFYTETKPEEISDLIKARDRIIEAINKKEKITIFGDYDVDGVTSTSCLLLTLLQFTDKVDFYIPSRLTEGYGLNTSAVTTIAKKNKKTCHGKPLLITCDCGITNHKEIELANSLGMDVIVTDHHALPEILPPACAVLNPKLLPPTHKLHFLPGVGVAYKLAEAILDLLSCHSEERSDEESHNVTRFFANAQNDLKKEDLLDLVTLGMIADLAPLVDENRYLVQIGLPKLANTKKVGLQELLKACSIKQSPAVNTDHVGFGIAPRINAVGRLTDAKLAVKLLTTNDLLEAVQIATELEFQNRERQALCEQTVNEAIALVQEQIDFAKDKCIVLAKDDWHHGVIGIVASRVVEKFHLPTILIAIDKEQNIARGSGRSVEQLNIVEALVKSSSRLEKFGGHKAACGLSVKPEFINDFILDFKKVVDDELRDSSLEPILNIDMELSLSCVNKDLLEKIYKLSPFGLGNKLPLFLSDEVEIINIRHIGKNSQHLKLLLRSDMKTFEALIWNHDNSIQFTPGEKIKIAYTPKLNHFNGEVFVQLEVKDWQKTEIEDRKEKTGTTISLYDFRDNTKEFIETHKESFVFFAETTQKDFLPLKTYSRNKLIKADNLVFLEIPPDEIVFLKAIADSKAKNVYLAFPQMLTVNAQHYLERLIGMLKYVKSNKNSIVTESELMSALGINKNALMYALETLVKIGYLKYEKKNDELSINISNNPRQDFDLLIEYNLFVSEVKQILEYKEWFSTCSLAEVEKIFKQHGLDVKAVPQEKIKV